MWKKGWLLFLVLLCVAFLISCRREEGKEENGELVRCERIDLVKITKDIDLKPVFWYNFNSARQESQEKCCCERL